MTNSKKSRANNGVKVLVVEDSPTQAEKLKQLLEENGYEVKVATDGRSALAELRKGKPDLIISDVVMPRMDGFTLCKAIKSKRNLKDVPIILLTALSSPQDVIQGLQSGADNFIRKPYEDQYLLSRLEFLQTNRRLQQNEKITVGLKVRFGGRHYFINSDRQQILNLLISVFEEAVQLNDNLEARQKELTRSYQSLNGLYKISQSLNTSMTPQDVAEKTLEEAVELPAVKAGWVILREGEAGFRIAATRGLPPALRAPGALEGSCLCRKKLLSGELDGATNVLECERLQGAPGDTQGLRYHASIPLWTHERTLGLLNLAGVESGLFGDADLKTLHSVGHQVAIALERAQLYESLEKRVEERTAALREEVAKRKQAQEEVQRNLDRIRALHEIDNAITSSLDLTKTLSVLIEKIEIFVPHVASTTIRFINHKSGELEFIASRPIPVDEWKAYAATARRGLAYKVFESGASLAVPDIASDPSISDWEFFRRHRLGSFLGIPLTAKGEKLGVICFHTRGRRQFSDDEIEFLTTLAGQAAIAIHNAQLYEETVRANKVKEEFLSVMSHELRTPLNVVMGYTAMMRDGLLGEINPKQGEALAKIISRSNDQLGMVNNILCATVFEAQKIKVQAQPVVLGEFLNQLRTDYEGFVDKPLELKWDCSSPSVVVHTDGPKLKQALQNLIDNAVKFTQRGSVTVSASVKEAIGIRQQWVEFKVADTGIGIPQEHLPFVFERFRQADSSETRLYGGVGLGLYIAKKFTELLGGKVEAESEEGKGSTFTVTLPINPTYRMSPEGA